MNGHANELITRSYWTSLARERAQLTINKEIPSDIEITKKVEWMEDDAFYDENGILTVIDGSYVKYTITVENKAEKYDYINIKDDLGTEIEDASIIGYNKYNVTGTSSVDEITNNFKNFDQRLEWNDVYIQEGEKIEIVFKAKVSDIDGNNTIVNKAYAIVNGESNYADVTCKTLKSNISINKKIRVGDTDVEVVEYGSVVEYEITITNNSILPDKVNIEDIFYGNEIAITSTITASGIADGSKQGEDESGIYTNSIGNPIGDKIKKWNNITIAPSRPETTNTITIKYKAKLTADIGSAITNTARAKSVYTGDEAWKTCTTTCTIQKTITTRNTYDDYNVILVLDRSASMVGQKDNVLEAAKNLIRVLGDDKVTVLCFARNVADITDNLDAYANDMAALLDNVGWATNYAIALNYAYSELEGRKNNYVVFMSDGAPTAGQQLYSAPQYFVGNLVTGLTGALAEYLWIDGSLERGTFTSRSSGSTLKGMSNSLSKQDWKTIMTQRNNLVDAGAKIYSVFFERNGNDEYPLYGLTQISTEKAYNSKSDAELITHFAEIATKIKDGETPKERTCQTSTIEIENYQKISKITIGSKSYIGTNLQTIKDQITPIEGTDNGTLNLNQVELNGEKIFKTNSEITITYKN